MEAALPSAATTLNGAVILLVLAIAGAVTAWAKELPKRREQAELMVAALKKLDEIPTKAVNDTHALGLDTDIVLNEVRSAVRRMEPDLRELRGQVNALQVDLGGVKGEINGMKQQVYLLHKDERRSGRRDERVE